MPQRPGDPARQPEEGARFLTGVLTENARAFRALRRLSQDDLAARMRALGLGWVRATVSEVERGGRNITVDELGALALALDTNVVALLDPRGVEGDGAGYVDFGGGTPVRDTFALEYLVGDRRRLPIAWTHEGPVAYLRAWPLWTIKDALEAGQSEASAREQMDALGASAPSPEEEQ